MNSRFGVTPRLRSLAILAAVLAVPACSSNDETGTNPSIALSLTPAAATVQQGGSVQVAGTLTRTNYTGVVTITVQGAPTGLTATVNQSPGSSNTAQVTLAASGTATVGTYTLTVRATGTGVTDATATFTLTIAAASSASYTMTLGTPALSVAQGASGTSTIAFVRTNFASNITMTAEGLPNGITASFNPAVVPALVSAVTLTVGSTVATGTYPIVIRGTASGLTDVTATLTLTVTGTGGNVLLSYTPCAPPDYWPVSLIAVQDGNGAWTNVTPSAGVYSTTLHAATAGFLQVSTFGTSSQVDLVYATPTEIKAYLAAPCVGSSITATGVVNNLAAGEVAMVGVGDGSQTVNGPGSALPFSLFTSSNSPDLLAVLSNAGTPVSKLILRRAVNVASVAPVDFTTAEAFAPATGSLAITGISGESATVLANYITASGYSNQIWRAQSSTTLPTTMYGVPAAKQLAADLHYLGAFTAVVPNGSVSTNRSMDVYAHTLANTTVAFAPLPATAPTISSGSTTPYARLRTQWQLPASHKYILLNYYQNAPLRNVQLFVTAGYLGGSALDITFPDLSSLTGWQSNWMPVAGVSTNWSLADYLWSGSQAVFAPPVDGWSEQYNRWLATITP